jgi:dolichol-phosphate mannosyltransferase
MRICVVLPTYNEEGNLTPLVTEIRRVADGSALNLGILIVDDGSTDGTAEELRRLGESDARLRVVTHASNQGFAAALRTGIGVACANDFDALVFMDADLSHRPGDLPKLIAALGSGADLALGSRFVRGGVMDRVPWWRSLISRTGNGMGRLILGVDIRDLTTGYRAIRCDALAQLHLTETTFTIHLETVASACAAGLRVVEVPITLGVRRHGVSHMAYTAGLFLRYWRLLRASRVLLRDAHR